MTTTVQGTVPQWDIADALHTSLRRSGVEVRAMAEYLGVSRQTVGNWTSGRVRPSTQTLRLWAMRTGVSYEWLCAIRDLNPEPADLELDGAPLRVVHRPWARWVDRLPAGRPRYLRMSGCAA